MVKGQDEIGENGTLHIQACANTVQTRMSALKAWLPRSHVELARNGSAIANYVSKLDTAVEGTQFEHNYIDNNANKPLTMADVMMKIAEVANVSKTKERLADNDNPVKPDEAYAEEYWSAVEILLGDNENLVALLTQPQYQRAWVKTRRVWLCKLAVDRQTKLSISSASSPAENILTPTSIE